MGVFGNFFVNLVVLFATGILGIVVSIFQFIPLVIPGSVSGAWVWLFGFISYADGILPITQLLSMLLFLLLVWKVRYGINLFLHTIFPFIPLIGKKVELPSGASAHHPNKQ